LEGEGEYYSLDRPPLMDVISYYRITISCDLWYLQDISRL